jgi:hypothetical protein
MFFQNVCPMIVLSYKNGYGPTSELPEHSDTPSLRSTRLRPPLTALRSNDVFGGKQISESENI